MVTPLVAFSCGSVFAFSITPPQPGATIDYLPDEEYTVNGKKWVTKLDPSSVTELPAGGTNGLKDLLNAQFVPVGWTFNTGTLKGSFNIRYYAALGAVSPSDGVGADFELNYVPKDDDPVNDTQTELYWIQRVFNNHNITDNPGHGNPENTIDVPPSSRQKPFTDPGRLFYNYDINDSQPPIFEDRPDRIDIDGSHTWRAELYLASIYPYDPTPTNVTIYNGVSWGWRNEPEVDFEVVVDTTGSMGTYISGAQTIINQVINRLDDVGIDYRVAVADYKDFPPPSGPGGSGDYPYLARLSFSSDKTAITSTINALSSNIGGGGDTPESAYSALIRAMQTENLGSWRDGVQKIVLVVSDAPPHDPEPVTGYVLQDVVNKANDVGGARIYSYVPGAASDAVSSFSSLSSQTGGNTCTTVSSCAEVFSALLASLTTPSSSGSGGGNVHIISVPESSPSIEVLTSSGGGNDRHITSVPESSPSTALLTLSFAGFGWSLFKRKRRAEGSVLRKDCSTK